MIDQFQSVLFKKEAKLEITFLVEIVFKQEPLINFFRIGEI